MGNPFADKVKLNKDETAIVVAIDEAMDLDKARKLRHMLDDRIEKLSLLEHSRAQGVHDPNWGPPSNSPPDDDGSHNY